ncbi:proton-conducting transporter transmembrane domain-containing protein [Thermovibrio ammonificans]
MEKVVYALFVVPWLLALIVFVSPWHRVRQAVTLISLPVLSYLTFLLWNSELPLFIHTPRWLELAFTLYDYGLLAYFLYQGFKFRNFLVTVLAVAQLFLLSWALTVMPHSETANLYVDRLSVAIYALVATVGSLICIYATKYMEQENLERENRFVAILLWFLGVMNLAVTVNNLEWFFALFETTTLASYILIRFRWDRVSVENALRALWMNQVGGIAILLGILFAVKYYGLYHFTDFLKLNRASLVMIPFGFLAISALVKGAQLPFHRWLLGAMVAPTPVSAILHSATMVKIAPYLILRLSPVIKGTLLAKLLIITTGFVFVAAGMFALTQDNFKRILAYSTISLLGLMMLTASMGSPIAVLASVLLILFHGAVKALLFMEAGIMEKLFKAKRIEDIRRLVEKAPITVMFVSIGFMSMTIVPFGIFVAKWLALEEASNFLAHGAYVGSIIFMAVGGVILTLLYFKVIGIMTRKRGEFIRFKLEKLPPLYLLTTVPLVIFTLVASLLIALFSQEFVNPIVASVVGKPAAIAAQGLTLKTPLSELYGWQIVGALLLLLVVPVIAYFVHFEGTDRVYPYTCGEKVELTIGTYNFFCISRVEPLIETAATALFVLTLILGGGLV